VGIDDLSPNTVRKFISRAGGTAVVASKLGVDAQRVIEWARNGITDEPDQAIALTNLGKQGIEGRGARPRPALLLPGELDRLVQILGTKRAAALSLKISPQTLKRYQSGKANPTVETAERVRRLLDESPVRKMSPVARTRAFFRLALTVGGMKAAAKILGISRSSLYRYANSERRLPAALGQRLSETLAPPEPNHHPKAARAAFGKSTELKSTSDSSCALTTNRNKP
jgi:DNA-binding transcriptional regulator YdaS (Cro superfamily)